MAGVTITSSPTVFWLACAQLRQIALRCYGRSLLSSHWSSFGRHLWYLSSHDIMFHRLLSLLSVLPQCLLLPQRIPRCRPTLVLWGELCDSHQMMTNASGKKWVSLGRPSLEGSARWYKFAWNTCSSERPRARERALDGESSTGAQFRMGEGWRHFESLFLSYPNRSAG